MTDSPTVKLAEIWADVILNAVDKQNNCQWDVDWQLMKQLSISLGALEKNNLDIESRSCRSFFKS